MSGYYYPPPTTTYQQNAPQNWSNWNVQMQYRESVKPPTTPLNFVKPPTTPLNFVKPPSTPPHVRGSPSPNSSSAMNTNSVGNFVKPPPQIRGSPGLNVNSATNANPVGNFMKPPPTPPLARASPSANISSTTNINSIGNRSVAPPSYSSYPPSTTRIVSPRRVNTSVPPPPLPPPFCVTNNYHINQIYQYKNKQWQQNQKRARNSLDTEEKVRSTKKKKKSLSQSLPSKKDWTLEDAQRALDIEKEYNKRSKKHLIIKFPDLELNREIVSSFHSGIESVHFQQPSTPRFCFVTLKDTVESEAVIEALNKTKFGDGYLVAEFKKDREDEQTIRPDDVDPLTLYVGNLAQQITKEDVVKTFPNSRRIDIGFAKKMKYTRYAFVSFKSTTDSLEAFKRTHNMQMFNKTLIVRFRRLNGTIGMPGEVKPTTPKKNPASPANIQSEPESKIFNLKGGNENTRTNDSDFPLGSLNSSQTESYDEFSHRSDEESVCEKDVKPGIKQEIGLSKMIMESFENAFANHRPKIKQEIKQEIKTETDGYSYERVSSTTVSSTIVKEEPPDSDDGNYFSDEEESHCEDNSDRNIDNYDDEEDDDDDSAFLGIDFSSALNQVQSRTSKLQTLRKNAF